MIDPMLSLAFTVHANPGVYALMLGSGISRTSGIPTGWEIVLDLVRKLAALRGEKCEPDEETWYRNTYGAEPNYSILLNELAKTPAERKNLLYPYFEPTPEEREQRLKVPTPAHRAIAELMAQGYFRVVLTTNFDTLMEDALRDAGVTPYVVRHPSDIAGAPPLSHIGCLVVKLHGDYLDTRIRNTPQELEQYEDSQNELLDRVVDEFGLIVCGWSAEWDMALRDAIARCKSRRYMTYWASVGAPHPDAQNLIGLRRGEVIVNTGADTFFRELADKVTALHDIDQPHPLTAKAAVASEKRFLANPSHRIRLNDLIQGETERVASLLSDKHFPVQGVPPTLETMIGRMRDYRTRIDILLQLLATGCYWGTSENQQLWVNCLERISNLHESHTGIKGWIWLRDYPPLLLQYVGGIAALANNQFGTLEALLTQPRYWYMGRQKQLMEALRPETVLLETAESLPGMKGKYVPASEHLFEILREPLADLVPDARRYNELFDRFEYLRSIFYAVTVSEQEQTKEFVYRRGPLGRFGWKHRHESEHNVLKTVGQEARSGALGNYLNTSVTFQSVENFLKTKEEFDAFVQSATGSW